MTDTDLRLTARERRWSLAAAIGSVTVFGLAIGEGGPLLSLLLEHRGTDATVNGLNAGSTFIGVMLGPLLTPRGVRRVGLRNFLLIGFALEITTFLLLKGVENLATWFVLRMLGGLIGSSIFTASEAWINLLAGDSRRGRVLGIYAAALSAGFGLGPLILSITGIEGWAPFLVNAALSAAAMLPLLGAGRLAQGIGTEHGGSPLRMFARAPLIIFAVAIFGLFESALLTLLPVWGVRMGQSESLAAATISAVYFGAIVMQVPIGWLSDHLERRKVLALCGVFGLLGAVIVAVLGSATPALFALLFVWGGVTAGIYPVALAMAGTRFRGGQLVSINAAMIMAYGLGAMVGPALGGAAMDLQGPVGLPGMFILLFTVFVSAIILPGTRLRALPG